MDMNNQYDREALSETVTLFGPSDSEPCVKLLIMNSGVQVIAEVVEHMHGDYYTLIDPRTVSMQVTTQDGQEVIDSISYSAWAPLSPDKTFQVYKSAVVSVCNPIESLAMSYKGATTNGWYYYQTYLLAARLLYC